MLLHFFFALRRRKLPVATQDWLLLMRGLELGLHQSSLHGFYELARAVLVKDVALFDAFDQAFVESFEGSKVDALAISDALASWLDDPKRLNALTEAEKQLLEALDPRALRELFEKRLREQTERHDGGSKWIGTGGTSPFGRNGFHPTGMSVGGGGRSAMQVAGERRFRAYRKDAQLDVRKLDVALRALRDLGREGAPNELDLPATIDGTAKNAGELEVVQRPPRRNRAKVILLMDVGGSMDPHVARMEQLFTAASRTGRFARFRHFYFHNTVYDHVYADADFGEKVSFATLLATSDRDEKLVVVGDAAMHPGELLGSGGYGWYGHEGRTPSIERMRTLATHFRRTAWLNPDPEAAWRQSTVTTLRGLFPMFPLTVTGIEGAVHTLLRGRRSP